MNSFEELKKELREKLEVIPEIKVLPTFNRIQRLAEAREVLVTIPKYNIKNQKASLHNLPQGGFHIKIDNAFASTSEAYDLELAIDNERYFVEGLYFTIGNIKLKKNSGSKFFSGTSSSVGLMDAIGSTASAFENKYLRYVIEVPKAALHQYLETESSRDEDSILRYSSVTLLVAGHKLFVYERKQADKTYFLIDSDKQIEKDLFMDLSYAVMLSFGLLSAKFNQKEAYCLSSNDKSFQQIEGLTYHKLRDSLTSIFNPIYFNPYGYTEDENIIMQVKHLSKVFSADLFSKLCTRVFEKEEYASLLILVLEANSASLILRPAGYAVALEQLTNMIAEENKGLKPILDKKLAKQFQAELEGVLVKYVESIGVNGQTDSIQILRKNIEKINNPTNRDKLTKPFQLYGIALSPLDLEAINHRNAFLHGRRIDMEGKEGEYYLNVFHTALRLNFLVNKLILKHIGYSGMVVNYVKHHEGQLKLKIEEELFHVL